MATMSKRLSFALLALISCAGLALAACGGGGGDDGAGSGGRVTDPAKVASSTPIRGGQPQKYEIHQDGSISVSGGATVSATISGGTTPAGGGGTYVVVSGDTCGAIAAAKGITVDQLIAANRAKINADCTNLHTGDELKIPGAAGASTTPSTGGTRATATPRAGSRSYTVRSGDTCADIAASFGVSAADIISLNNLDPGCQNLQIGQTLKIPG